MALEFQGHGATMLLCRCSLIVRTAFQWNVAIRLWTDWWWNIAFFGFVEGSHGMGKGFTKPLQNEFHRPSSVVSRLNVLIHPMSLIRRIGFFHSASELAIHSVVLWFKQGNRC